MISNTWKAKTVRHIGKITFRSRLGEISHYWFPAVLFSTASSTSTLLDERCSPLFSHRNLLFRCAIGLMAEDH